MSNATSPAAPDHADDPNRPASCPYVILDPAGVLAGWTETEDGAERTRAQWSAIDGAAYTWRLVAAE